MYLSKIRADRRRWDVTNDLEDRDRLHKKFSRFFQEIPGGPCDNARQQMGVLFRVEHDVILVQSNQAPRTGIPGYEVMATKDVSSNYDAIKPDTLYRFRLEANTSIRAGDEDSQDWIPEAEESNLKTLRKTKRVGCGNYPARAKWFEAACRRSGIMPEAYFMDALAPLKVGATGFLEVTRFDGHLKVTDRERFLRAIREGIGQGKAYGLGLLSIRNA